MRKRKSFYHKVQIYLRSTRRLLNIRSSSDPEGTIESIGSNIVIKGYNVWILVCAAMLASIGLDTNSTAVIIGAMLISPLMSPILGIGMGLGINDRGMFYESIRNLVIATLASLFTSCIYFLLTPYGDPTPEIMARTQPTLLDVGVALFGGIAGIVSGSRKEKTNAIPGVAIATALMPPLCAAGYGLAKFELAIFFGAFYLFFINAVFISLSTFIIVKYLEFPMHQEPDEKTQRTVTRIMSFFLIIVIIPSIYFLVSIINRQNTISKISDEINKITVNLTKDNKHEVLNVERPRTADEIDKITHIKMYVSGDVIEEDTVKKYEEEFKKIDDDYTFTISTLNNVSPEDIKKLSYSANQETILEARTKIELLETKIDTIETNVARIFQSQVIEMENRNYLAELKIFYPDIKNIAVKDYRTSEQKAAQMLKKTQYDATKTDTTHNKFEFVFSRKTSFPYLVIDRKIYFTKAESDSLQKIADSLYNEKTVILKPKKRFPYISIQFKDDSLKNTYHYFAVKSNKHFPYMNIKFFKDSLLVYQNQTEKPKTNQEQVTQSTPVTKKTIEIIITWYSEVKNKKLSQDERKKIYDYLLINLKPDTNKDSLVVQNLIDEEPFSK